MSYILKVKGESGIFLRIIKMLLKVYKLLNKNYIFQTFDLTHFLYILYFTNYLLQQKQHYILSAGLCKKLSSDAFINNSQFQQLRQKI